MFYEKNISAHVKKRCFLILHGSVHGEARPISRFISEMIRDIGIVTIEYE